MITSTFRWQDEGSDVLTEHQQSDEEEITERKSSVGGESKGGEEEGMRKRRVKELMIDAGGCVCVLRWEGEGGGL